MASPKRKKTKTQKESDRGASSSTSTSSPSPHSATATNKMVKVTINVQPPDSKRDPLLISYPGGVPEELAGNNNSRHNNKDDPPKFLWRQLNAKSVTGRTLEGHNRDGSCLYRASIQGMGFDDRRTKMCVGIYDKQTKTVTLHQAASRGTVYAMQQYLPSYQESITEDGNNYVYSMALFEDFGSAKKRKVLKSQQSNRVNVDHVIGAGSAMVDSILNDNSNSKDQKEGKKMSESNRRAVENSRKQKDTNDGDDNNDSARSSQAQDAVEAAHREARKALLPPYFEGAKEVYEVYDPRRMAGYEGWGAACRAISALVRKDDFFEAFTRAKIAPPRNSTTDGTATANSTANEEAVVLDERPPEERGWPLCVLECARLLNDKASQALEEEEENQQAMKSDKKAKYQMTGVRHQLRCLMILHYLMRFWTKFQGKVGGPNAGGRGRPNNRRVPGVEEGRGRWFGIPAEAASCFLQALATEHIAEHGEFKRKNQLPGEGPGGHHNNNADVPMYIMSRANRDKCAIYILLTYIMARGGSKMMVNDITPVVEDLGLDIKEAGHMLRSAGLTVTINPASKRAKALLTVPLTFPKPRTMGRGKR